MNAVNSAPVATNVSKSVVAPAPVANVTKPSAAAVVVSAPVASNVSKAAEVPAKNTTQSVASWRALPPKNSTVQQAPAPVTPTIAQQKVVAIAPPATPVNNVSKPAVVAAPKNETGSSTVHSLAASVPIVEDEFTKAALSTVITKPKKSLFKHFKVNSPSGSDGKRVLTVN